MMTNEERHGLKAILEKHGWDPRNDSIIAPSGGLWLDATHFELWTLAQVRDTFQARATRIEMARIGDWETSARENRQVAEAAAMLISGADRGHP